MEQGYFSNPEASQDALTQLIGGMKPEGIQTIFGVIAQEAEEFRLDSEKRKTLTREYGMSGKEVSSWQTAADVVKHFDSAELVRKHPQAAKNALIGILSIFPPTRIAAALTMAIPDDVLSNILGFSLTATPDHLINMLVQHQARSAQLQTEEYERRELPEEGRKTLAIVTKDDLLFALAKKLTGARNKESAELGEEALRLVRWEEGRFEHRYKTDTIEEKVLLIGNSKSAGNAVKVMDVRFEKYGVKYGWIGNCAFIHADLRKIRAKGVYEEFLEELSSLSVPEEIKADKKLRLNVKTGLTGVLVPPLFAKDLYDDTYAVRRQMYFYGAVRFFADDLGMFLND